MNSQESRPSTFVEALKPYEVGDDVVRPYAPFKLVTKRMLGEEPSFYPLACLSAPAINTHVGLFSKSFHSPQVDIGLSRLTPELRRAAFLSSSLAFECSYCTAHACAFGDMLRGSVPQQIRGGGKVPFFGPNAEDKGGSDAMKAVTSLAGTSQRRCLPSARELKPLIEDVEKEIGSEGLEATLAVICFTGCLNTFMDMLGVELESETEEFASDRLQQNGIEFSPGMHKSKSESPAHQFAREGRILGVLHNTVSLLLLTPTLVQAILMEKALYVGIPSKGSELDEWIKGKLGGQVPSFWKNINGIELKRAVGFGLRENLLPDTSSDEAQKMWKRDERCAFVYTYGHLVDCKELQELAGQNTMSASADSLNLFAQNAKGSSWSDACKVVHCLIQEVLEGVEGISRHTIERAVETCDPKAIVELASLLSWCCYWYRLVTFFGEISK